MSSGRRCSFKRTEHPIHMNTLIMAASDWVVVLTYPCSLPFTSFGV